MSKISKADIYKRLWQCRDFEIDHVWQRAVFLSAFLLGCYAAYGGLFMGLATAEKVSMPFPLLNIVGLAIAFVGLLLSLVWIMMAKGSKAWYEHYENAIGAFEQGEREAFDSSGLPHGVLDIHKEELFKVPTTSSCILNTKGGAYSVAKINVVIGHISALIWVGLIVVHSLIVQRGFLSAQQSYEWLVSFIQWPELGVFIIIALLCFWLYSHICIRSTFLKDT